jgi:type 1 glutamine amidotransferase
MHNKVLFFAAIVCFCALIGPVRADDASIKALLVAGGCCHDYKTQKTIITEGISARANVQWTIIHEGDGKTTHRHSIYEKDGWADAFDVIVHDECTADVKDIDFVQRILKPHKAGKPAVILHCAAHSYRTAPFPKVTPWFEFTGLQSTGHGAQLPIAITFVDSESPIIKGMQNWTTINEELYNNSAGHLLDTAHALARGKQGKDDFVVVWTNTYGEKTRVFATTIGHNNKTVADPRYLDLITRGLLWSVDKLDEGHLKNASK